MAKFTGAEWDDIRKKFRNSIMADTALIGLAQESRHQGVAACRRRREAVEIHRDSGSDELLMLSELAGNVDKADHLISILENAGV